MLLAHPKRLAQNRDRAGPAYPPNESHASLGHRQLLRRHHEARRQLLQAQAAAVLRRRLAPEARVNVLGIDRLLQPSQLAAQVARPSETLLEQRLLKPAVEVLHA